MYYCYLTTPIGDLLLAGDDSALSLVGFPEGAMRYDPEPDWIYNEKPFADARQQPRRDSSHFGIVVANRFPQHRHGRRVSATRQSSCRHQPQFGVLLLSHRCADCDSEPGTSSSATSSSSPPRRSVRRSTCKASFIPTAGGFVNPQTCQLGRRSNPSSFLRIPFV